MEAETCRLQERPATSIRKICDLHPDGTYVSTGVELIAVIVALLLLAVCKNRLLLQLGKNDGMIAVVMTLSSGRSISLLICVSVVPTVTDT
jgi:uncharacterized membrane protein YkgB